MAPRPHKHPHHYGVRTCLLPWGGGAGPHTSSTSPNPTLYEGFASSQTLLRSVFNHVYNPNICHMLQIPMLVGGLGSVLEASVGAPGPYGTSTRPHITHPHLQLWCGSHRCWGGGRGALWGGNSPIGVLGMLLPFGGIPATTILSPLPPEASVGRLLAGFPRGHVRALPKTGEEAVGLQRGSAVPL